MNESITQEDALRRFPELRDLVTMTQTGWVFRVALDGDGELECVMASRSVRQYTDALFIYDRHNITGTRLLDDAFGCCCVWLKQGTDLQEIVRELIGLPEPGEPGAPTLVKRSSVLWTP